jgi:hypothetical protein
VSLKSLPAMVNETSGIDDKDLQSTIDSPFGLGRRSQSCNKAKIVHENCGKTLWYALNGQLDF